MSTRQGLPEALETGENRCLLNLGTLTSQGNYTFMFLGWLGKERTRHWLLENPGTASQWGINKPCFLGCKIFRYKF